MMDNIAMGIWGEAEAVKFLKKKKYKIIETNYRCSIGEVDIIAIDGPFLVFVEVKTRASTQYGLPMEAVDEYKQHKLIMLAQYYQKIKRKYDYPIRFDVVQILDSKVTLIKNAFYSQ